MNRTTNTKVTFKHSFVLSDVEGDLPPGTYDVETDEKAIDEISFMAYSHVSTRITVGPTARTPGRTVTYVVNPHELAAAIAKDAAVDKSSISDIQQFIRTGGKLTDAELSALMRGLVTAKPLQEQRDWLRQIELSLDGYGGEAHLASAARVASALGKLRAELGVENTSMSTS